VYTRRLVMAPELLRVLGLDGVTRTRLARSLEVTGGGKRARGAEGQDAQHQQSRREP
jgi:hypothetical protein